MNNIKETKNTQNPDSQSKQKVLTKLINYLRQTVIYDNTYHKFINEYIKILLSYPIEILQEVLLVLNRADLHPTVWADFTYNILIKLWKSQDIVNFKIWLNWFGYHSYPKCSQENCLPEFYEFNNDILSIMHGCCSPEVYISYTIYYENILDRTANSKMNASFWKALYDCLKPHHEFSPESVSRWCSLGYLQTQLPKNQLGVKEPVLEPWIYTIPTDVELTSVFTF